MDAAWHVQGVDGRLHLVHVLAALAAGAGILELDVLLVEFKAGIINLRHDRDGGGGRVDPPLGLRRRHPLHAVDAALELHLGVDLLPGHLHGGLHEQAALLPGGGEHTAPHALPLAVPRVHGEEVLGPEGGLVATNARLDLDDGGPRLVRGVRRQHGQLELLGAFLLLDPQLRGLLRGQLRHLVSAPGHLSGFLELIRRVHQLVVEVDDLRDPGKRLGLRRHLALRQGGDVESSG
mmetsp:Transcript_7667/g.24419  ORF Transcript_7667/g.24419 Transcript_7667/m.24419 type:complete len:235 (+) Transcript_7667:756-1460(+)